MGLDCEQPESRDSPFNHAVHRIYEEGGWQGRMAGGTTGHLGKRRHLFSRSNYTANSGKDRVKENSQSREGFLEVETLEPGHEVRDIF